MNEKFFRRRLTLVVSVAVVTIGLFVAPSVVEATVYINQNAESLTCGANIPESVFWPGGDGNPTAATGHVNCGGAPQGNKYFEWTTVAGQGTAGNSTPVGPTRPTPNLLGTTIYLGMYLNFTRINGVDIWYKPGNDTGDKGTELFGNGIRWDIGQGWGTWGGTQGSVGHYTIWEANPSFHLNPSIEYYDAIPNNRGGYGVGHSVQLTYDTWHSLVRVIRFSNTNTGYVALYADGVLISEYDNIITAANNTPDIDIIGLGGTMCQPAYDCPPHHRRYDAFLLTDSWQDIVNGGYLGGSDTTPPAAPTALGVQ